MLKKVIISGFEVMYGESRNKLFNLPFIFVHGAWEYSKIFKQWMAYAANCGIDSYAINLPGRFGSYPKDVGKISNFDNEIAVRKILRKIGGGILVGHCNGGLVTQMASQNNSFVKALVLASSAPARGIFLRGKIIKKMWRKEYLYALAMNKPLMPKFEDIVPLELNEFNNPQEIFSMLVPDSGRMLKEVLLWKIKIDAKKIRCPIFVIAAKKDVIMPIGVQKAIRRKFDAVMYKEYASGHMLMLENGWEKPIEDIIEFCKNVC